MNSEKERLIRLIESRPAVESGTTLAETIAEHLLENGVIVPPCKLGTKYYRIATTEGKRIGKYTYIRASCLKPSTLMRVIEDYGKTVFLSEKKAIEVSNRMNEEFAKEKREFSHEDYH